MNNNKTSRHQEQSGYSLRRGGDSGLSTSSALWQPHTHSLAAPDWTNAAGGRGCTGIINWTNVSDGLEPLSYKTMWFWSRAAAEPVVITIQFTAVEARAAWRSTPRMHCTTTDDAKKTKETDCETWCESSHRHLWPDLSRTRALPQRSSLMEGSGSQWTRPSYITVWNYSGAGTGLLFWRDVLLLFSFSSSSVVNKPSLLARTLESSPHFFPLSWNDPAVATATEQKTPIGSALRFEAGVPAAVWKNDVIRHIRAGVSNTVTLGGCG